MHNASFDRRLLNQTATACGLRLRWPSIRCSLHLARELGLPASNANLFRHFRGEIAGNAHRALVDCQMTLFSYNRMIREPQAVTGE
jgi:DNA polymerase III epsilon subunit-like protein